jgi:hypothetical protein
MRAAKTRRAGGPIGRTVRNVRTGRMQKMLSAATAASAIPLTFEVYLEHYKGSFGDKWEWVPIALAPAVVAAGAAGVVSERAARTWLPLAAGLYGACGLLGTVLHARGVQRRPGGFREPTYNLVMGPPLLAPGSLGLIGAMGILAAIARRER